MIITLRIPTKQYEYAEVSIAPKDKAEAMQMLQEIDKELTDAMLSALQHTRAVTEVKSQLGATTVNESKKPWERKQESAPAAKAEIPSASDFFNGG